MQPKKIETLLLEGTPFGLRYHDLANWTGRVFVCPRASFKQLLVREELTHSGIYLLIGNDEATNRLKLYVGEADVIKDRIIGHNVKDFWSEIVVVAAKDQSLDKASVRYIESMLVSRAQEDKQCDLENGNTPAIKNLSEANVAVMNEFIENIIFMLSALGYKIIRAKDDPDSSKYPVLFCESKGAKGRGRETDEGFIVYKGSTASKNITSSWEESGKKLQKKLLENGVLVKDESNENLYTFTQDYVFNSPSQASGMIFARSTNGRYDWRTKDGKKLMEIQ